jgi:hypothetical protein
MGAAGKIRARRDFAPELMVERTIKLYEEVLEERGIRAR